jgi:hypothetical protein
MRGTRGLALSTLVGCVIVSPAYSQDHSLSPNSGSADASAGFTPDPYRVQVTSGGTRSASSVRSGCAGWVSSAPDFTFNYDTDSSLPLHIFATSNDGRDIALLINGPSGDWSCDDDSGEGLNPTITFQRPRSGEYDVWVASYNSDQYVSSTLTFSEIYNGNGVSPPPPPPPPPLPPPPPPPPPRNQAGVGGKLDLLVDQATGLPGWMNIEGPPVFRTVTLASGFRPDPHRIPVVAGGPNDISILGGSCVGFVSPQADVRLFFTAGKMPLFIRGTSEGDTSLAVRQPDGSWLCDDDSGGGLNPLIQLNSPMNGRYDVFVGTFSDPSARPQVTLTISEINN